MAKKIPRLILPAAIAVLVAMIFARPAPADQELAALLSSSTQTISAGEPIILSYEVDNQSGMPVRLPAHFFSPIASDGAGLFFNVVGENNQQVNSACPAQRVEFPDATVVIQPGEFHGRKSFNLSECYKLTDPGEYTIAAQFSSQSKKQDVWRGVIVTNTVTIKVRESDARKRAKIADALIAQWLANYDYSTAPGYKKKILSLGTPAAIPVAAALGRERRLLPVNDLLDLLGGLPCRESADALAGFVNSAPTDSFISNMPEGFSSSSIIRETAFRSLEKIFSKTFTVDEGNIAELWTNWVKKYRGQLPPALPANSSADSTGQSAIPSVAAPKSSNPTGIETYPLIVEPKDKPPAPKQSGTIKNPKSGGKIK
jgi:hypothetical protein